MPNMKRNTAEMEPKVIKSEAEYRAYLKEVERLVLLDPSPDSEEGQRLELFALLVEAYEKGRFHFENPDPIEAIEFRMNEQGLRQVDLVPYFGSRSRVSEVLARKRPLTVQMIRDVSAGLGIPAEILVSSAERSQEEEAFELDWQKFPAKEMKRQGYFVDLTSETRRSLVDLARDFYTRVIPEPGSEVMLTRQSLRGDAVNPRAKYGLMAWKARVLDLARKRRAAADFPTYVPGSLNLEFLSQVARLSWHPNGIKLACELVEGIGIPAVIEPRLSGTQLDGAAILDRDGSPVVALTLRFDRIDSFWFTLLHELVHIMKHLRQPGDAFLDRLEDVEATETLEIEANRIARDVLIPRAVWRRSELASAPTKDRILRLAKELNIHPAIVAGRVRRETGNYTIYGDLIGSQQVRRQFANVLFE